MSNTFIYNHDKKELVEKAGMKEPPVQASIYADMSKMAAYDKHIAQLKRYPCNFLQESDNGKEFVEGKNFRIEYYMREGLMPNNQWKVIDEDWYTRIRPDYRKIEAIPIQAAPEEIPDIKINDGVLTISITADQLKWIAEHKSGSTYKVLDAEMFLNHFAANLEDYASPNSVEVGLTELQSLFDKIIDETYTNASEAIIDTEENL